MSTELSTAQSLTRLAARSAWLVVPPEHPFWRYVDALAAVLEAGDVLPPAAASHLGKASE